MAHRHNDHVHHPGRRHESDEAAIATMAAAMAGCGLEVAAIGSVAADLASEDSLARALSTDDRHFLMQAIDLSKQAVKEGNHPFGCVIVERRKVVESDGCARFVQRVVVEACNNVCTGNDPTAHAELSAVRRLGAYEATRREKHEKGDDSAGTHDGYELFTSTEPCIMCCGAIYWSFLIDRIVYACPEQDLATHAGNDFLSDCRDTLRKGKREIRVQGPFYAEEAEQVHADFWPAFLAGKKAQG
jgi:tRNA(Arg) A34 adenosine deaminase TadA